MRSCGQRFDFFRRAVVPYQRMNVVQTKEKKTISRITVRKGGLVTLPARAVRRLGIKSGHVLDVVEHENTLTLVLQQPVPKGQAWYHTPKWRKTMKEAFAEFERGEVLGPFENAEDAIRELKRAKV